MPTQGLGLSADGRHVVWTHNATTLTGEAVAGYQIFARDTCIGASGACTPTTTLLSRVAGAGGNDDSFAPSVSGNGRFVTFMSEASDLAAGDTNGRNDVFVADRCVGASGCTPSIRRVSIRPVDIQGDDHSGWAQEEPPDVSDDGSVCAFTSRATNLVMDDTNGTADVFIAGTGY